MPRVLIIALFGLLLLVPATAGAKPSAQLRGTVASKAPSAHRVSVKASRRAVTLRVPGSLARIEKGQRVELRGSTLRAQGGGSPVLARGVTILSSKPIAPAQRPSASDDSTADDDGATADDDDDYAQGGPTASCDDDDDDDTSGSSSADDEDDDHSGPGSSCDDDDDHGSSGPGSGDDDHGDDD